MKPLGNASISLPQIRLEQVPWPNRDADVVRVFVGDANSPHEIFHIAVSGTAVATLRNHEVDFDLPRDARKYLERPGVLASLLAESAASRAAKPDEFFEKCFTWRDLGNPVHADWM